MNRNLHPVGLWIQTHPMELHSLLWEQAVTQKVHWDAINTHPGPRLSSPFAATWTVRTLWGEPLQPPISLATAHLPVRAQKCQWSWPEIWIIHFNSRVSLLFLKAIWKIKSFRVQIQGTFVFLWNAPAQYLMRTTYAAQLMSPDRMKLYPELRFEFCGILVPFSIGLVLLYMFRRGTEALNSAKKFLLENILNWKKKILFLLLMVQMSYISSVTSRFYSQLHRNW